jgi:hypothetical protein
MATVVGAAGLAVLLVGGSAAGQEQGTGVGIRASDLRMTAVPLPGGLPAADLRAVALGTPGYVAVGATVAQEVGPVDTLILSSPDGAVWTAADLGALAQVGSLEDVVALGDGFVAVGSTRDARDRQHAIALASTDGATWAASTDRDLRNAFMSGVTAWADGVLAVGCRLDADGLCGRPTAWTSTDGLAWERHALPRAAGDPGAVASGDGLLVVLGISSAIADGHPVISTTSDLATWTRRTLAFEGSLESAIIDRHHVIGGGTLVDQDGDVLFRGVTVYSPDAGGRWIRLPLTAPGGSRFDGIAFAGPVIAYGSREGDDLRSLPTAWVSLVGADWSRIQGVPSSVDGWVADLVPFPDRPGGIAVGATNERGDDPTIWVIEVAD